MPFEQMGWAKRTRFLGAMRYHGVWLGRLVGWVLAVLLAGNALMIAAALAGVSDLNMGGVSASMSTAVALLMVCACLAAHSRTRFLLRFGTPRLSVWLSNLLALFLSAAVFLVGTLALNLAVGGAVLGLSSFMPDRFSLTSYASSLPSGAALLSASARSALERLPQQLLWLAEYTCLFYLLACCLRRRRGLTLAVIIGVPFVCFMLMLMPIVNQTVAAIESGSDAQVVAAGLQWMQWLVDALRFIRDQWQWIQLGAAVVAVPLSYLCMRGTPQP